MLCFAWEGCFPLKQGSINPSQFPHNPPCMNTNTYNVTAWAWASWFPYAAFRDALSRTWATWGSLGTGKSHSNSSLKICLCPSQHRLNINSFMLAICKQEILSDPVLCVYVLHVCPLPASARISVCFYSRNKQMDVT